MFILVGLTEAYMLPMLPGSGSSMVGETKNNNKLKNWIELEASLVPTEAEIGAEAKDDQLTKMLHRKQGFTNNKISHLYFT